MIKTPSTTTIGGAGIWTPSCTVIGGQQNIDQLIKSLFADGTQGLYLNAQDAVSVSDLSSIKDLSGRNNHALQANATSRASLITDPSGYKSLKFDGIDDGYVTQSIDFTGTDKLTVIAAVRKLRDSSTAVLLETSIKATANAGSFFFAEPNTPNSSNTNTVVRGATNNISLDFNSVPVSTSYVKTVHSGLADSIARMRINSVLVANNTGNSGGGAFGNYPLYIGRRGGGPLPFDGQIYAILVIGKLLDDATTAKIEKEFAKYIGVTL